MPADSLMPGQEMLLGAMIAAIAVVWSIGVATYWSVWNYFYSWSNRFRGVVGPRPLVRWRYWQNLGVFVMYAVAGAAAFASILVSGFALLRDSPAALPLAWNAFAVALGVHFGLFTFEILTSILHVWRRLN